MHGLPADRWFCASSWPVTELVIGGLLYHEDGLVAFLEYNGDDVSMRLVKELVATKLNVASGADSMDIEPVVDAADAFLEAHPPVRRSEGRRSRAGEELRRLLKDFNHGDCKSIGSSGFE